MDLGYGRGIGLGYSRRTRYYLFGFRILRRSSEDYRRLMLA
jgi:hypothetical protein